MEWNGLEDCRLLCSHKSTNRHLHLNSFHNTISQHLPHLNSFHKTSSLQPPMQQWNSWGVLLCNPCIKRQTWKIKPIISWKTVTQKQKKKSLDNTPWTHLGFQSLGLWRARRWIPEVNTTYIRQGNVFFKNDSPADRYNNAWEATYCMHLLGPCGAVSDACNSQHILLLLLLLPSSSSSSLYYSFVWEKKKHTHTHTHMILMLNQ